MTASCVPITDARLASIAASQVSMNSSGRSATPSSDMSSYTTTLRTVPPLDARPTLGVAIAAGRAAIAPARRRPSGAGGSMRLASTRGPHEGSAGGRGRNSDKGAASVSGPGTPPDGERERFTISVLSERSGTGIPTIHHYRRIGLLPPALEVASNRFLYQDRHVEAHVIRLLRERRNLPLEAIREV